MFKTKKILKNDCVELCLSKFTFQNEQANIFTTTIADLIVFRNKESSSEFIERSF